MKKKIREEFNLKGSHRDYAGWGYDFVFQKRGWVKGEFGLMHQLEDIKRWADGQMEFIKKNS